jgi:hypothetical protein
MSVDLKSMCFQGLAADFVAVTIPEVPEVFSLESAASDPTSRPFESPCSKSVFDKPLFPMRARRTGMDYLLVETVEVLITLQTSQ